MVAHLWTMVCRQFADRIWSSKNLCSGGTALPVILSSNDRCVFGFFSNLPPLFLAYRCVFGEFCPVWLFAHLRHITGVSSVFFKHAVPKEKKGCGIYIAVSLLKIQRVIAKSFEFFLVNNGLILNCWKFSQQPELHLTFSGVYYSVFVKAVVRTV